MAATRSWACKHALISSDFKSQLLRLLLALRLPTIKSRCKHAVTNPRAPPPPPQEYVEPNYILEKQGLPVTDPRLRNGELWGMYGSSTQFGTPANQFGSNAIAAWYNYNMLGSTNVFVGVIDEVGDWDRTWLMHHSSVACQVAGLPCACA